MISGVDDGYLVPFVFLIEGIGVFIDIDPLDVAEVERGVNLVEDVDGRRAHVVQRKDDTEQACVARLQKYHSETAPIIPFYRDKGLLKEIDGVGTPAEVTERITQALGS